MNRRELLTMAGSAIFSSACENSPVIQKIIPKDPEPDTWINIEALKSVDLAFPWRQIEGSWYLLQGPQSIGDIPQGVRNAIDIAPREIRSCPPPQGLSDSFPDNIATSAADGVVEEVSHAIIKIRHKRDLVTVYIHARPKLKLYDEVRKGDLIGEISCDYPQGGYTTGIHLHFAIEARITQNNKYLYVPIPIDGFKIGGWTIVAGQNYGEGKMTKQGEPDRIANLGRCDDKLICTVGGQRIRNNLPNPHPELLRP